MGHRCRNVCATLATLFKRLEDLRPYFKERRTGGTFGNRSSNCPWV